MMNTRILLLVLALVCIATCIQLPRKKIQRKMIFGRPKGGFVPKPRFDGPKAKVSPDQYVTLPVDHFNASNTATYQKRYWYNNEWYKPGGPIFLYSIGEATGEGDWIAGGMVMSELAQNLSAFIFGMEHRYYGKSQVPGQSMSDISTYQWLSSRQELADLNAFVPLMNAKFGFTSSQKWVTFGGSYAGGLTAQTRALFPNTFYAGVGSSGVVNALVDYIGYMNVVQDVISTYTNNQTNLNCGQVYKDGIAQVINLVGTANGRQQLFKGFQLCQPLDPTNALLMGDFYSAITDAIMGDVQYGEYRPDCAFLTNTANGADALTRLQKFVINQFQLGSSCLDIDYNDQITEIKQDPDYFNWFYQTCSEFGWYQTTDGQYNINFWGNTVPVTYYVPQCASVYGSNFGNTSVYQNIINTNMYYGGSAGYNGTMVILPNGLADPWHLVTVMNATNNGQTLVQIPGASHCEDMNAISDNDFPALKAAKITIMNKVLSWFN